MQINKTKHKQISNFTCYAPTLQGPREKTDSFHEMGAWLRNAKPYLLLLAVQFGSAGMFIFAMDAIRKGMSHYVFIVYRNAIAAITLSPFAFFLERFPLPLPFIHNKHLCVF